MYWKVQPYIHTYKVWLEFPPSAEAQQSRFGGEFNTFVAPGLGPHISYYILTHG